MAERILTDCAISISELKTNPMQAVASADGEAVAVLNRNKPAFYAVPVDVYEQILERLDDMELVEIVKSRQSEKTIEVSLDDL